MSEWDRLKEEWKNFDEYDLTKIWAEGDKLQEAKRTLGRIAETAIKRANSCDDKLDAIQKICTDCNILKVEECFNDIIRIVAGVKDPSEVLGK